MIDLNVLESQIRYLYYNDKDGVHLDNFTECIVELTNYDLFFIYVYCYESLLGIEEISEYLKDRINLLSHVNVNVNNKYDKIISFMNYYIQSNSTISENY